MSSITDQTRIVLGNVKDGCTVTWLSGASHLIFARVPSVQIRDPTTDWSAVYRLTPGMSHRFGYNTRGQLDDRDVSRAWLGGVSNLDDTWERMTFTIVPAQSAAEGRSEVTVTNVSLRFGGEVIIKIEADGVAVRSDGIRADICKTYTFKPKDLRGQGNAGLTYIGGTGEDTEDEGEGR